MKKRTHYKTCPTCGAALDVGERCECERIDSLADDRGLRIDREQEDGETVYVIRDKKSGNYVGFSNDAGYLINYLVTGRVGA